MFFAKICCIALAVYLFQKAIAYEKSVAVENEEEEQAEFIEEIHERVTHLFSLSKQGSLFGGLDGATP